jgi:hypothetical protein
LRNRKLQYVILVIILAVGILLSTLSQIPTERRKTGVTDIPLNDILLQGHNKTYNLENVDSDNYLSVTLSQVKEQRSGRVSEEGLYHYFYRDSEPSVKRYENRTGVNSTTDSTQTDIVEEGQWNLFIMNQGNATLSFRLNLEWEEYSDVPVLPGMYLTYGILLIIYSVLFISIIAMRDRFKRKDSEKVPEKENKET